VEGVPGPAGNSASGRREPKPPVFARMINRIGRRSLATWVAAALGGLAICLAIAILVLVALIPPFARHPYWPFNVGVAVGFSLAGFAIVRGQPANLIGWLFLAGAVGNGLAGFGASYAAYDLLVRQGSLPAAGLAAGLVFWTWLPIPASIAFTLALFPDGRSLSPRWRPVPYVLGAGFVVWALGAATTTFAAMSPPPWAQGLRNPVELGFGPQLAQAGNLVVLAGVAAAAVSMLLRFRRSRGEERQQLKWLAVAVVPLLATFVGFGNVWVSAFAVAIFVLPIAMAILKYRLYDLDLVVNRALVYAALSAIVVGVYVVVAGAAGLLASGQRPTLVSVLATLAAVLLVLPLRQRMQHLVDHLLYGRRREPLSVVTALARRLEAAGRPDELLHGVVVELADALRLVSLEVRLADGQVVVSQGQIDPGAVRIALIYQGLTIGELAATARRGENLSPRDTRFLQDLAPQVAVALHALQLTLDLQRSRERLVFVQEEERRRIRRDLHDGLGPMLTAVAFQADAARNLVERDPGAATQLLKELRTEVSSAISEIRRLVYGLRPPALDEVGLVEALRQHAGRFAEAGQDGSLAVEIDAPGEVDDLPAAVEVAAYRIAAEAINNAARHSHASHCRVRLSAGESLEVEVVDDGSGWPDGARAGVGLTSMRERAEELGGRLVVGTVSGGGSSVLASIPLRARRQ
jgi:two-component system, NarL family, sensor kinase